jgi:hypothetical protein
MGESHGFASLEDALNFKITEDGPVPDETIQVV